MGKIQRGKKADEQSLNQKKNASAKKVTIEGIKKQYIKSNKRCRVTFRLPKVVAPTITKVSLVGEFNNWNNRANTMKKNKDGQFTVTLELETGREYQFRYFINNSLWENDDKADKYLSNPFGSMNSVIVL